MTAPFRDVRVILFDWDGTLLNSVEGHTAAFLFMFRTFGIHWTLADLERHYSPDWYRVYRAAKLPRANWKRADRVWRTFYARHKSELMPGARTALESLASRFTLGLVTSGDRARVRRELRRFRFAQLFRVCIYAESTERRKPHPDPLKLALRRLRIPPESAVYVGDSPEDILMAQRAGLRSVAVLGPFPTHAQLRAARANALIKNISLLPKLFR